MKKLILFVITIILFDIKMYGQINLTLANDFVRQSASPGLFIVKQSFQVSDKNGKKFGWNNQKSFAEIYSVGIKTDGGYYVHDKAVNPWKYDDKFAQYKDTYTPVLYETYIMEFGDTSFKKVETFKVQTKDSSDFYFVNDGKLFGGKGFSQISVSGKKEFWTVWFPPEKKLEQPTQTDVFNLSISKTQINISDTVQQKIEPLVLTESFSGGIVLLPDFSQIGTVKFHLCGFISEAQDGYVVHTLKSRSKDVETSGTGSEGTGMLTPVEEEKQSKNNKKKK